MTKIYTATVLVDGRRIAREFRQHDLAAMWLQAMTAQYMGRISAPSISCTVYSDIFHAPMRVSV